MAAKISNTGWKFSISSTPATVMKKRNLKIEIFLYSDRLRTKIRVDMTEILGFKNSKTV